MFSFVTTVSMETIRLSHTTPTCYTLFKGLNNSAHEIIN